VLRAKAPGAPRRTYRPAFLTKSQAHYYEKGRTRISAARLLAIADALGVGPGYFYEEPGAGRAAGLSAVERMAVELVRNFAGLPSRRHQEAVCALVRTFAARCGEEAAEASPAGPPKP
jgi:transcriptional regulator with XRE-family HTH domain